MISDEEHQDHVPLDNRKLEDLDFNQLIELLSEGAEVAIETFASHEQDVKNVIRLLLEVDDRASSNSSTIIEKMKIAVEHLSETRKNRIELEQATRGDNPNQALAYRLISDADSAFLQSCLRFETSMSTESLKHTLLSLKK